MLRHMPVAISLHKRREIIFITLAVLHCALHSLEERKLRENGHNYTLRRSTDRGNKPNVLYFY